MKENDYYGHYNAFVKELKSRPDHTLQVYCQEKGIVWRRLYDWMRRHHISLKKLYQTYRPKSEESVCSVENTKDIEFREVIPIQVRKRQYRQSEAIASIAGVCVSLPSGITVNLGECSVAVLSRLIVGLTGKEGSDVLS